jgi:hypothetical protein
MVLLAVYNPGLMPTVYDRLAYMASPEYLASSERGGRLGRWIKPLITGRLPGSGVAWVNLEGQ